LLRPILIDVYSVELPSLEDVRGGFNLQSTEEISCTKFDSLKSSGGIKGDDYTCEGNRDTAESKTDGLGTKGNGTGSDSGSPSLGAQMGLVGLAAGLALIAF
jgi:hypothetical protein